MFDFKIISILTIIIFLFIGCEEPTNTTDSDSSERKNTLNDSSLGSHAAPIKDYFYNFDEEIEARFLYYNAYITRGANTINNPNQLDPFLDTLSFRTFPYYIVDIEGVPDTISYMLSLTPENLDSFSTLYPLDEINTSTNNWCNEMLVQYEGNCPNTVEVDFDYQYATTGTGATEQDTLSNPAVYSNLLSTKKATFNVTWTNIDSIVWDLNKNRYDIITPDSTLSLHDTLYYTEDFFDSSIYVGVIDTSRYSVDEGLMYIDRTEWSRYDTIYQSVDKPIILTWDSSYQQIKVPEDSPLYHINGDCNQNLSWDTAETYYDFGPDMCPDSLETGPDTYVDSNGNGIWDETESLINDWNEDGKWTKGFCEVVDTDSNSDDVGYGQIIDEAPCNCLGDWRIEGSNIINNDWDPNLNLDPNGDNWLDCGWDGYCPGHPSDTNGDENGTESNQQWDIGEGFEKNGKYDLNIINSTGEYFIDSGNGVLDVAEFCITGNDGVCDGNDPFEDRNCNEKWDKEETVDNGNSIWDDNEGFIDSTGNGIWDEGEPLYVISDRLGNFIVDYAIHNSPVQITVIDTNTSVTLFYGNPENPLYIIYDNFLESQKITVEYFKSFHDIDSKVTIYTNKIIDYPIPGNPEDYHLTKSRWYQEVNSIPTYGYNYSLFKIANDGSVIQMHHPHYFHYYGYWDANYWKTKLAEEEIIIYSYDGLLRDGEYYYQDTTIVTSVADYYIQNEYEVFYDMSVEVPFKKKIFNETGSASLLCIENPLLTIDPHDCYPMDTTLTNTFKIIKTQTMTMIGNGLEWGRRTTVWYGSAGPDNPLGIVKSKFEIRWSEPYWQEYGSGWNEIERLELRSLHKTSPEFSRLYEIFQPVKHLSLKNIVDEGIFDNDPYVIHPSYGFHILRKSIEQ